jgi:hypothetical protein
MKSRRKFSGSFTAQVAMEALKEQGSLSELSEKYQLEKEVGKLYEKIGRLEVQIDFLKKKL